MRRRKEDPQREERISQSIIVDAYNEDELATGWYYYLEDAMSFPFSALCVANRRGSPLRKGERARAYGMATLDYCKKEVFVEIEWAGRKVAVPLSQIKPTGPNSETIEAVEDWHYWVSMGYEF